MFLMRLKLAASGSKSGVGRIACTRVQAAFEIDQISPAGGHAGANFVVREAADIAEVIFDAVAHELAQLGAHAGEIELHFALDDDSHDALRGAAQRERISRAGRNQCRP